MEDNPVLSAIFKRRSIRKYKKNHMTDDAVTAILEAGRWAPSGLNNQPWRFAVIRDKAVKEKLADCTDYSDIVLACDTAIAVFYDLPAGYNRDKDAMSIGACIQNMLLAAHSLGIGSVWLGEILNQKTQVNSILGINAENELMALITFGYPNEKPKQGRKELDILLLGEA
jgi:nitroreductase